MSGNRRLIDDFAISNSDDAGDISAALYKERLNDQKIEKLGNRITIISILLPCLIGAFLVYGYLDIKERVSAILNSDQTQVDIVAKEFEAKLNAFEVEFAKVRFSLEKDIPELKQEIIAIQDELTLIAGVKSDKEETDKNLNLIKESITKVADQYQGALHILDRTNQETLTIVNENGKELETKIEEKMASVKTIEAEIEAKVASIKTIETDIEKKVAAIKSIEASIDDKLDSKLDSKIDAAISKNINTSINSKLSSQNQALNKKVADIELSVESKLATLEEATQILAENKIIIAKLESNFGKLEGSFGKLDRSVDLLEKELKNSSKSDSDKKYIDTELIALKKNLSAKIDHLDLNLSRKILQYVTQLESSIRDINSGKNRNSGTKKKTESTKQENKPDVILKEPERGKISETDLTR
ncbi:MAG: hypothetical protein HQK67_07640 [Desulfamplus sp.]|nr:hypothetical protein [Desulfamplus sp.]